MHADQPHRADQPAPLDHFMQQLMSQELPMLDSASRARVAQLLREHQEAGRPTITSQAELPEEIRSLMEL